MLLIQISLLLLLACFSNAQDQAFTSMLNASSSPAVHCESDQSYLIEEMNDLNSLKNLSSILIKYQPFPKLFIKRSCIQSALSQVGAGRDLTAAEKREGRENYAANNFVRCEAKRISEPDKTFQETPCQTENSIKLVHNSFETVTQCLKDFVSGSSQKSVQDEWVKLYFKTLTKESGLQNYVQSKRGALGAGQLTSGYINDFLKYTMKDVKNHLKNSDHQECKNLGKAILSEQALNYMAIKSATGYKINNCSLIGVKHDQIIRNLLIGFSNLKTERLRAQRFAFKNKFVKIPQSEQHTVELALVPLAYNMGSGNLNRTIRKATANKRTFTDSKSFIQAVKKAIPFAETRAYEINIENRYKQVVKDSGEPTCFN